MLAQVRLIFPLTNRRTSTLMHGIVERVTALRSQKILLFRSEMARPLRAIAYIPSITTAANEENDEKDNQTNNPIVSDSHEDDDP